MHAGDVFRNGEGVAHEHILTALYYLYICRGSDSVLSVRGVVLVGCVKMTGGCTGPTDDEWSGRTNKNGGNSGLGALEKFDAITKWIAKFETAMSRDLNSLYKLDTGVRQP